MAIIYVTLKQCSSKDTCVNALGSWLPATKEYFYKQRDGFHVRCKACIRLKSNAYYASNAEAVKARVREYGARLEVKARHLQIANKAAARARGLKWYRSNKQRGKLNARKAKHIRRAREYDAEGTYSRADIKALYELQDGRCCYCGIPVDLKIKGDVHIDHMIPLSRGGSNSPQNLAVSCAPCNLSKNNKLLSEWKGRTI